MRILQLVVMVALVGSVVACSRKKDSPPGQQSAAGNANTEATSNRETIENGLLVIRTRYPSATRYTPEYAAKLIDEYDTLKRAEPIQGPKKFWETYGSNKTVLEVEGVIDDVAVRRSKEYYQNQWHEYMMIQMHILPSAWASSESQGTQLKKVDAQIATASQTACSSVQKGQKVIVRGVFGGFNGSEEQHPRGELRLFLCQLVSPRDG